MARPKIKSLLVADDDMDDVMLLLSAIGTCCADVNVSHVHDGAELLTFLESKTKPELVLLDINMPKINGIDCLKSIKSNESCKDIPIIMYSTTSNSEIIDECFQSGASRFIIKPFTYNDIVKFMKIILDVDWNGSKIVTKEKFLLT